MSRVHAPAAGGDRLPGPARAQASHARTRATDVFEAQADRAMGEASRGKVTSPLTAATSHGDAASHCESPSQGRALDPVIRADMEARFACNFSSVRIHTDATARRQADDHRALAWTHGHHIGFAAGRYEPTTSSGRDLLAHELAHVVQQARPGARRRVMCKPRPDTGQEAAPVAPATPEQKREFVAEAVTFLRSQGEFFSGLPRPADPSQALGRIRTTFQSALPILAADTSAQAREIVANLHGAYTEAVRQVLTAATRPAPGSSTSPPTLASLYESHRADIEPFAMPIDSAAAELSAELEAQLPANPSGEQQLRHRLVQQARGRMRVSTAAITLTYADAFEPTATHSGALPAGMTVRLAGTIPDYLHPGFREIVARMTGGILEANSTVMLALDLRRFGGGNDAYRFTRIDLASGPSPQIEVWIERQGAVAGDTVDARERNRLQQKFDGAGFRRDSTYSAREEFDQALIGVGEVPDAHLSGMNGLLFKREGAHPTSGTTAAEYRMAGHEIAVFDRAYGSSISRQGRPGRTLTGAAYIVAHEVGHAADLSRLRTTQQAKHAAEQPLLAEFSTGPNSWGYGRGTSQARRDRYAELDATRAAAATAEQAARSRSGARWQTRDGVMTPTHNLPPRERIPEFRAAARRDDGPGDPRMPTNYPGVDPDHILLEYYAESFALYQTNPDLLRRIRPNVFAFFQTDLPR